MYLFLTLTGHGYRPGLRSISSGGGKCLSLRLCISLSFTVIRCLLIWSKALPWMLICSVFFFQLDQSSFICLPAIRFSGPTDWTHKFKCSNYQNHLIYSGASSTSTKNILITKSQKCFQKCNSRDWFLSLWQNVHLLRLVPVATTTTLCYLYLSN